MIRLLVADDHALVRDGIRHTVERTTDIVMTGEARNGREVLDMAGKNDYEVVLLDISMPGRDGLDVLKALKAMPKKHAVLVLSMYPEEQYAIRALRSGAAGYLTKESAPDELITAIRKVSTGGKYVSETLAEKRAGAMGTSSVGAIHEQLSDREYQIMCMLASGMTQTQIADQLSLSIKTISTYRTRILVKMSMSNNAEITRYAIDNRLI
jgi:two-component system, NarL family, invasion response regulator UvrY